MQPGGKTISAMPMAAVVSGRKVDVQPNGCEIFEVFVK